MLFSKQTIVPAFENFDLAKEEFGSYHRRLRLISAPMALAMKKIKFTHNFRISTEWKFIIFTREWNSMGVAYSIPRYIGNGWPNIGPSPKGVAASVSIDDANAIIIRTPHRGIQAAILQKKAPTLKQVLSIVEAIVLTSRTLNVIENEALVVQMNILDSKRSLEGKKKWQRLKAARMALLIIKERITVHIEEVGRSQYPHCFQKQSPKYSSKFQLRERVKKEIDQLVANNIFTRAPHIEWPFQIVVVTKVNAEIRIRVYIGVGLNSQLHVNQHFLSTINDLVLKLKDRQIFSKIDPREKCELLKIEDTYLDQILSSDDMRQASTRVYVIIKFPKLGHIAELMRFIGKVYFYTKYIPNYAMITEPLNLLRQNRGMFVLNKPQQDAFENLKT
ncbi:hypothetical protein RF11_06017 [Thelohanellus kitauei]|uniref:Uncharacterized protein n=1 Tax=Thelohanellus kitauei TaxID=669202 RepID=A0A0C2MTT6_THEKT|nr:hypothetical protein RF11_06017 [Thelohanellus kitauei]